MSDKIGKLKETFSIVSGLSREEKHMLAEVTEDLPLNKLAGLQKVDKLWEPGRVRDFLFLACQMLLNVLMSLSAVRKLDEHSDSLTRYVVVGETAATLLLTGAVVVSILCLVLCSDPVGCAKRHYFMYLFLPAFTSKFSFITFLHLANKARLKSFVLKGELQLYWTLIMNSVSCSSPDNDHTDAEIHTSPSMRGENKWASYSSWEAWEGRGEDVWRLPIPLRFFACLVVGIISLCSLLNKLKIISFAGDKALGDWTRPEFIVFLGFVNQLGGLVRASEVEMHRVLLFKFGGEHSSWQQSEIDACSFYFSCLAERMVADLKLFNGIVMMSVFSSTDLQWLLLGKNREEQCQAVRAERLEMLSVLSDEGKLKDLLRRLIDSFQVNRVKYDTDIANDLEEFRAREIKNMGKLRLAANVAEFVSDYSRAHAGKRLNRRQKEVPDADFLTSTLSPFNFLTSQE